MLSHNLWSRSRISRIIIYALVATTVLLLTAAGSNVAVFSTPERGTAPTKIKPGTVNRGTAASLVPVCATPPSGMVSSWAAENNPLDTLGRNNGVLHGNANYLPGMVGNTFNLDGNGDFVQIAAPTGLPVGNASRTVELWFKTPVDLSTAPESGIFQYGSASSGNMFGLITSGNAPGKFYFYGHNADLASATTIQANTWYHGAVTYDGTTIKLYLNGQLENSAPHTLNTLLDSNGITIGYRVGGSTWTGQLDEPTIYDRALSITEIATIYNAGTAGKCRSCAPAPVGLVSLWQAEDNALDVRSRNNGTLQNGTVHAPGKVGQAFSFDGLTQYVEIPDHPSLRPTNGMTLEGWFKFNIPNPSGALIAKPLTTSSNDSYVIWTQLGQLAAGINVGVVSSPFSPIPGEWYHIAYTYDEATFQNRLFVNGEVLSSLIYNADPVYDSASVLIGIDKDSGSPVFPLFGSADEVSILDRALTIEEVRQIVFSGSSGKCGPTATTAPAGLVRWWGGDGDFRNLTPAFAPGNPVNQVGFVPGRVGQAFRFTPSAQAYFWATDSGLPTGNSSRTVEFWAKPSDNARMPFLYGQFGVDSTFYPIVIGTRVCIGRWGGGDTCGSANVTDGQWHHFAMVHDESTSTTRLYVDGQPDSVRSAAFSTALSGSILVGGSSQSGSNEYFSGDLDEVSFFDRALSQTEIQSIYNAGIAGKLKSATTPIGFSAFGRKAQRTTSPQIVNTTLGDATISFPSVATAGTTQQIPLDPTKLPPLPIGYVSRGLTYDIATTAIWNGTPSVCFNVPALSSGFVNLRILHLENGEWVDRTLIGGTSPNVCSTGLTSLSPFALANVAPTATGVSVSGRVTTSNGNGIRGVRLILTAPDGATRTAITSTFGYFTFDSVEVGHTYVLEIASKRFTFADPTRVFSIQDTVTDMDFTAEPQ